VGEQVIVEAPREVIKEVEVEVVREVIKEVPVEVRARTPHHTALRRHHCAADGATRRQQRGGSNACCPAAAHTAADAQPRVRRKQRRGWRRSGWRAAVLVRAWRCQAMQSSLCLCGLML
jgi:hypothetical protein